MLSLFRSYPSISFSLSLLVSYYGLSNGLVLIFSYFRVPFHSRRPFNVFAVIVLVLLFLSASASDLANFYGFEHLPSFFLSLHKFLHLNTLLFSTIAPVLYVVFYLLLLLGGPFLPPFLANTWVPYTVYNVFFTFGDWFAIRSGRLLICWGIVCSCFCLLALRLENYLDFFSFVAIFFLMRWRLTCHLGILRDRELTQRQHLIYVFNLVDRNQDGRICFSEFDCFYRILLPFGMGIQSNILFSLIDQNGDGYITLFEFEDFIRRTAPNQNLKL